MHANFHYAVGVIIASLTSFTFRALNLGEITLVEYILIIFFSFGVDFDIFFSKYAKNHNHRNLFTHSIFIPVLLIIFGVISIPIHLFESIPFVWINTMLVHNQIIIICGISYLIHILFDLVDWGVRLFYWGKTYGLFILISQEEKNLTKMDLEDWVSEKSAGKKGFFVLRYYSNPIINLLEFIIGTVGFFILFTFNAEFWYIYIGYFLLLDMHLGEKKKYSTE